VIAVQSTTDAGLGALWENAKAYDCLLRFIRNQCPNQDAILLAQCIRCIATFAANHHCGRFADGAIENPLMEIGLKLEGVARPLPKTSFDRQLPQRSSSCRHVLHVATNVSPIGGHTRTIENWIANDPASAHSLYLTRQASIPLRSELCSMLHSQQGGPMLAWDRWSDLTNALQLRRCAQHWADCIILHHSPNDVVPVIALATDDSPPVAILNHADHVFWLGSSVADSLFNLRTMGAELSRDRRAAKHNLVLPIPLSNEEVLLSQADARVQLGIAPDRIVYLSVGRADKYSPTHEHDFFVTATKILDRVEHSQLIVVGPEPHEVLPRLSREQQGRVLLPGGVADTSSFRAAADIYIESFPFGSHTAALEAGRSGLPLVLAYYTPTPFFSSRSEWLDGIVSRPTTEAMYVDQACRLAQDAQARKQAGQAVKQQIAACHRGKAWRTDLRAALDHLESMTHAPASIPVFEMKEDEMDIATAQWHWEVDPTTVSADAHRTALKWLQGSACHLRDQGHYADSARLLWHLARHTRGSVAIQKQIFKLAPHWAAGKLSCLLPFTRY
jgi:hypothetical protein